MTAAMRWTISLLGPQSLTTEEMSCKAAAEVAVAVAVEAGIDAVDVSTQLHYLYKTANPSPQSTK